MNLKPLRRILKYFSISLLGLILLVLLFLFVGLNLPFIQKQLGRTASKFLEKKIDTPVNIDKVAIHLFDRVALHGVYFEDQNRDTLLATSDLMVDIDLKKLIKKNIEIDKVIINDLTSNIIQKDSIFNFQYIIDAFVPKNPKPKKQNNSNPWNISLKQLKLSNTHALIDLKSGRQDIALQSLKIDLKTLDLQKMIFDINEINIQSVNYVAGFNAGRSKRKYDPNIFPLYTVPVKVTSNKLVIENSFVDILTGSNDSLGTTFNPQRIYASDLNLDLKDIYFDSTRASLTAKNISTDFGQQIDIQHLSGNLIFSDHETGVTNLELKTAKSEADLDARLSYEQFKSLIKFDDDLQIDIHGKPINIHTDELSYFVPTLAASFDLNQLPSKNIRANATITGTLSSLNIKNFDAHVGATRLYLSGLVKHPTKLDKMQFTDVALGANVKATDIEQLIGKEQLPIDLNSFGKIELTSNVSGDLKDLVLKQFNVKTDLTTHLDLSGSINNIDQPKHLHYNLQINALETTNTDVSKILDSIPDIAQQIEFFSYTGNLKGSLTSFDLDGKMSTNLGEIIPDLKIDFNNQYTYAVYNGELKVNDFQLGKLFENDSIGNVTMTAMVNGCGLSIDSIDTRLDATINSFVYNGYEYNDLVIDGYFDRKEFKGDININDENVAFSFKGKLGLNDDIPNLNFTMQLDTLNLGALHLTKMPLSASLVITSNLGKASLEDMDGELKIKDIRLSNDGKVWATDSIALVATTNKNGNKELSLVSEIMNGSVVGDYSLNSIVPAIMQSLDEYFPFSELITTQKSEKSIPEQSFKGEFFVSSPKQLTNFLSESNYKLDTAILMLDFDSRKDVIDIDLQAPAFSFGTTELRNISVVSETANNQLSFTINSDSIVIGNSIRIPSIAFATTFKENIGTYGIQIKDEEEVAQFALTGQLTPSDKLLEVLVDRTVVLDARNWRMNMKEPFVLGKNSFEFPAFDLVRGDQGIFLSKGEDNEIDLYFEAFEASNLTNFILNDSTSIDGSINGSLMIATQDDPLTIEGDLYIGAIQYNGIEMGNLGMEFQNIGGNYTTATIDLSDLYTDVHIEAILSEGNKIDGEVDIQQMELKAIEPFLRKYVKDITGGLQGQLVIGGNLQEPDVNGTLSMNDVSAKVVSLGSTYAVKKGDFNITKDNIKTNVIFIDSLKRTATLKGNVTHKYFSNFGFNLNFNARSFTFLDSRKQPGLPFYGKLNAELDADITGTINKPEIFAVFATQDSTDITIEANSNSTSITNEPYVIFVDRGNYTIEEIDSIINLRYKISTIFDLTVYANINDKAKLKVVIDPISGDYLDVLGNGNMVVDVNESGELLINGSYEVTSGQYRFTFEDFFLKRNFEIIPGGQITFVGDIMSSKLDLAAAYKLKTSTYSLIKDEIETLSESEIKAAKDPTTEVNVVLSIKGELTDPQIEFDIKIPQNSGNIVNSSVVRALEKIRSNKTDLNTQVFSLLLLQGFTTTASSSTDVIYNTGSQIAFNSVSSFINNQLKKLTNKAKGLEVGVGIASSSNDALSDNSETDNNAFSQSTNIDVFIKQSLLNDRLVLEFGTNLDLNSGSSESGLTNVAGDFVLEYKLTSEGNLRLNVFQKSDYSLLNDDNVWKTGIGLSYQKTFGKLIKNETYKDAERKMHAAPTNNEEEEATPDKVPNDAIENKEDPKPAKE
ncbi:MAG: translocation/assembly module TamB domain-containing protein [Bacteroidetes bacterium]|nr:translocation/assembly module TamB domain-containing protein [Bacteroidota bacterium]